jgi:glycosyltransferase involved in cell wall biosynthesis
VEVVKKCIQNLLLQTLSIGSYEILIVDDELDDTTEKELKDIARKTPCTIKYLRGPRRGVGAARNLGVLNSRSEIVLIIGNDIIASPDFLAQHLKFHKYYSDNNCAVLGQTKLHSDAIKSPFMRIWGDIPYWEIADKIEVPAWYFFTGNISFKKSFFVKYGMFDEDFLRIGFEDIEVGVRLKKQGLKIMYNKNAVAYHDHPYTFEEACLQQINHGYNFGILIEKLKVLDLEEYLPLLGERYGIIGWHITVKGWMKDIVKKLLLHRKFIIIPLKKMLMNKKNPGRISYFLYPKVFNYYTNQGFSLYKKDRDLSQTINSCI